jgi:hypothetical protein
MAKPMTVAAALALLALGVFLLIAVSYAPHILGLGDDVAFLLAASLRGLGFLLLLGAASLLVRANRAE